MALHYDLRDCDNVVMLPDNWPLTQVIIFDAMAVGLGELTERNLYEWKIRSDLWRKMQVDNTLTLIPLAELRKRIGLKVNVASETFAKFLKRHVRGFRQDMNWKIMQEGGM